MSLKSTSSRYNISTISNQSSVDKVVSFRLDSPEGGEVVQLTNVLVIPDIHARHPSKEIDIIYYPHLSDLPLNNGGKLVKADILIGMDNGHLVYGLYAVCIRILLNVVYSKWGSVNDVCNVVSCISTTI